MAKIKYMGSADRRILAKGENFGGRLADPLEKEVVWDTNSAHLVDSDEAGLSTEAVELLLEDSNFKDVTDNKKIPASLNEQIFKGYGRSVPEGETDFGALDSPDGAVNEDGTAEVGGGSLADAGDAGVVAGSSSTGAAGPVGGSTATSGGRGSRGGSTR